MRLVAAPTEVAQRAWPRWPAGWSALARSVELKRGAVKTASFAGAEVVLFRGEDGVARVVSAYCPHMGAHLGRATVQGNALQCPLHHRLVSCPPSSPLSPSPLAGERVGERGVPSSQPRCEERFGLVFVTRGDFRGPLPEIQAPDDFVFTTAAPVDVRVPWANFVLNGFDLPHLEAVHHRALINPAKIIRERERVMLEYETRITGRGLSDLTMKWLSGNHVRARMSCFGTVGIVEADLGWTRSVLICGVTPKTATQHDAPWPTGESRAWVSFGVPKNAFAPGLRAWMTKWLYLAFLERDFAVLEGQRLSLENVDDEGTLAVAEFLTSRADWNSLSPRRGEGRGEG